MTLIIDVVIIAHDNQWRERNNCVDMARGDTIWKNITHLRGQYHVPMFPIDLVHIALLSVHDKYMKPGPDGRPTFSLPRAPG